MFHTRINKDQFKQHLDKSQKEGKGEFIYDNIPFKNEYAKLLIEVMDTHCKESLAVSYSQYPLKP